MLKKFFGKIFKSEEEKAAQEEEYFKRTANKHYQPADNKPKFSDDYFKSTDGDVTEEQKWQQRQQQAQTQAQTKGNEKQKKAAEQSQEEKRTARKTEMSNGVTIIDNRDDSFASRKIFAPGEGEYIEFEEA